VNRDDRRRSRRVVAWLEHKLAGVEEQHASWETIRVKRSRSISVIPFAVSVTSTCRWTSENAAARPQRRSRARMRPPDVGDTAAIRQAAPEYEASVTGFVSAG
jgi:hypothetical protein